MRPRLRSTSGPRDSRESRPLELVRVRGAQRNPRHEGRPVEGRPRRRGGRGRGRGTRSGAPAPRRPSLWRWLKSLFGARVSKAPTRHSLGEQELRTIAEFSRHYKITFRQPELLKLALTHRSYLSVTGMGPQDSNERLEFLGDSVLGLVTSEFLYRQNPHEHEGQLTKTKSLLVSKAILSRRALAMGLGRFVLMSHSEVESGGRQRLSIIADAFEAVLGAIYLDQGFEAARQFVEHWLLREAREIAADKRHTNYKSHLQEYVQSTFHTHPVYRIRSEMGPDHSKQFMVEVLVGKRSLGQGRGRNKKDAEQAAARDALEKVEPVRSRAGSGSEGELRAPSADRKSEMSTGAATEVSTESGEESDGFSRRARRGGRGRRTREERETGAKPETLAAADVESRRDSNPAPGAVQPVVEVPLRARTPLVPAAATHTDRPSRLPVEELLPEVEPVPPAYEEDFDEEVGRPEGPLEERHIDPYAMEGSEPVADESAIQLRESTIETVTTPLEPEADEVVAEDLPEPEDGEFQPAPGTLFSHDREAQEERSAAPSERGARFGRRGRRRGR